MRHPLPCRLDFPTTLLWLGIGVVGLVLFGVVELFIAKTPLLDMRLFGNRIFRNASLLGYVSTIALFGAEFLLPIYLQAFRGRTALQTGFILLPMAITGGIFVTLSGGLYDRVGPRPLMVVGFSLLMINTWQLSQIQADTTIGDPLLLMLRGVALGLTVQTTLVTALSVVPRRELAGGSSLINATRLVVQSIGVALLATVLASAMSPEIQALQNQFEESHATSGHAVGLCETCLFPKTGTPGGSGTGQPAPAALQAADTTQVPEKSLIQRACRENVAGFENAYKVTFFAALIALILGTSCLAGLKMGRAPGRGHIRFSPLRKNPKGSF